MNKLTDILQDCRAFKMFVPTYHLTWREIPEDELSAALQ